MPPPSPALSRRAALLGAVAVGATACTPYEFDRQQRTGTPTPSPEPEPRTDPDVALAAAVLADEQAMLARVDAVLARHPRLRRLLSGTRAGHEAHVGLLSDAAPDGGVSPSPTTAPTKVPGDARRAVRQLARLEDELSLADKRSAFDAQSGGFARVLASMAASAAQQSAMLSAAEVRRSSR